MPEDTIIAQQTPTIQQPASTAGSYSPQKNKSKIFLPIFMILILLGIGGYLAYFQTTKPIAKNTTAEAKFCQGIKIVFFPGGSQANDSFAATVYNGAKAAETTLGANVQYVWSGWDSNKMVEQFQDAMSTSPDAIALMGHPGVDALSSLVDEAERKGIIVTIQNVDLPTIRGKYTNNGFGYVGQDLHASGLLVSNGAIRKYQPKAGDEAIVFGNVKTDPTRYERTQGLIDGLTADKLVVHEVTIPIPVLNDAKSAVAQKLISDAISQYPKAKIILIDSGNLTGGSAFDLKTLGKKPGDYIVAGFDLSPDTVDGIKSGYIGLIEDQQPYLQGFLPVLQACLTKKYGFAGLYVDTGIGLIDSSNVDLVAGLAKQGVR